MKKSSIQVILFGLILIILALLVIMGHKDKKEVEMKGNEFQGKPASYWRQQLMDKSDEACQPSLDSTFRRNPDPASIPVLLELLQDEDPVVRFLAVRCISFLGAQAQPATPALIQALNDIDDGVRLQSALALGKIGPKAKEAITPLQNFADSPDKLMELHCLESLWKISGKTEIVIPRLIKLLTIKKSDDESGVREGAAKALGEIGPTARKAIPALIETLQQAKDSDYGVRIGCIEALGKMGNHAKHASTLLKRYLTDENEFYRVEIAASLWAIDGDPRPVLPVLIEYAGNIKISGYERINAIKTLGRIQQESDQIVPVLIEALKDSDDEIRPVAAQALGEMRKAGKQAVA